MSSSPQPRETNEPAPPPDPERALPGFLPFGEAADDSLIDAMLEMKISDRLRTLCHYVNAIKAFHAV